MNSVNEFAIVALTNPESRPVREALQKLLSALKAVDGGLSAVKPADRRFIALILNRLGQPVLDHIKSSVKSEDLEILEITTTHRARAVK